MTPDQLLLQFATDTGRIRRKGNSTRHFRLKAARLVHGSPEVLVKVVRKYASGPRQVARQISYVARGGEIELENERGELIKGKQSLQDIVADWGRSLGDTKRFKRQRDTMHMILSMPERTPEVAVLEAARAFTRRQFSGNREYLFALHSPTNDPDPSSPNPHVHVLVKMRGFDGKRLDPQKDDLQAWREAFAEAMRDQGEDAEATPRAARGVLQKGERSVLRHLRKRLESMQLAPYRDVQGVRSAVDEIVGRDHPSQRVRVEQVLRDAALRSAVVARSRLQFDVRRLALSEAADFLLRPRFDDLEKPNARPAYQPLDSERTRAVRRAAALYQSDPRTDGRTASALAVARLRDLSGFTLVQEQGPAQVFLHADALDRLGRRGAAHLEMRRSRAGLGRAAGEPGRMSGAAQTAADPIALATSIRAHLARQPDVDDLPTRHQERIVALRRRFPVALPESQRGPVPPLPAPAPAPRNGRTAGTVTPRPDEQDLER